MSKRIKLRDAGIIIAVSILPVLLVATTLFWWQMELEEQGQYNPIILSAARRYHVPKALIKAVIWRESRFNATAHGTADERGLMQVTPAAGMDWAAHERLTRFHPDQLFDPRTNIYAGTWYLSRALERWKGANNALPFALGEYNAGPVHARRWSKHMTTLDAESFLEVMDYPSTKKYITDITERMKMYEQNPSPDPIEFLIGQMKLLWSHFKKSS